MMGRRVVTLRRCPPVPLRDFTASVKLLTEVGGWVLLPLLESSGSPCRGAINFLCGFPRFTVVPFCLFCFSLPAPKWFLPQCRSETEFECFQASLGCCSTLSLSFWRNESVFVSTRTSGVLAVIRRIRTVVQRSVFGVREDLVQERFQTPWSLHRGAVVCVFGCWDGLESRCY